MRAALEEPAPDLIRGCRPGPGRRPSISGLPEIGTIVRKSATADLRWLASRAPQGDGNESVLDVRHRSSVSRQSRAPYRVGVLDRILVEQFAKGRAGQV